MAGSGPRKLIYILFSFCVLCVLAFPLCTIILQEAKVPLPKWLTSQDATYLTGSKSGKSDLSNRLSFNGFKSKELQNGIEDALSSKTPFKAQALLGNAALQRAAIASSNLIFGWDCYPTFYGSGFIAYPAAEMTLIKSLRPTDENTTGAQRFSEVIGKGASDNPDVRFVYQIIDETHSNPANPSYRYLTDTYYGEWFNENVLGRLSRDTVTIIESIDDEEELREGWFSTEHHWQIDTMMEAYDSIAAVLDLQPFPDRDKVLITNEWQGSNARSGLIMDYPSVFYDIPTDFSYLKCLVDGKESSRGARADVLSGELPLKNLKRSAYYNLYHWYYGQPLAEVIYENKDSASDKTLLFIEQSYGVPMEPYLASNYKTTVCISPANAPVEKTLQQYIDEYDVDDVVVQMGPMPYSYMLDRSPSFLEG